MTGEALQRELRNETESRRWHLEQAVLAYISECDNPSPDYNHRRVLRNRLRELVNAPPEPKPRQGIR